MARSSDLQLDAAEIVDAAVEILREQGLDAVSMRSVSARLGVSPVPLYSRVGNKDALLDAVAERLLHGFCWPDADEMSWQLYAVGWARELRAGLRQAPDVRLILGARRWAYAEAGRPLIAVLRRAGFASDAAVRGCRLLMWATVGFVAVEGGPKLPPSGEARRRLAGGDPAGVTQAEKDALFETHIRYVVEGITRDAAG